VTGKEEDGEAIARVRWDVFGMFILSINRPTTAATQESYSFLLQLLSRVNF